MVRRKTALVLTKLTVASSATLESMVTELAGQTASRTGANAKPAPWSRRFTASGKPAPAPKIRS